MTASFVISLDFELMWGVRDHRSARDYGDAVLGGRKAIPMILARFQEAGIRATWATVGLLFAKNRKEMLEYAPRCRPYYENANLSPYYDIENALIGENAYSDPFHFAGSLISRIADTCGQEIATHTYSHFYCMEPGATEASFKDDLESARSIAENYSYKLESIVFPRNQTAPNFIHAVSEAGIKTYRGDANGWLYKSRGGDRTTNFLRLARFVDGAFPIGPKQMVYPTKCMSLTNVSASRFLRPWTKKMAAYHHLHVQRIESEMMLAARTGGSYHIWWHPHNFGRNTIQNLQQLDRIIARFKYCRDEFGMVSRNMADFARATNSSVKE